MGPILIHYRIFQVYKNVRNVSEMRLKKCKIHFSMKCKASVHVIEKKGLNKFFVPINITNFDFNPYKIKLNVFILIKKFILFFVLNGHFMFI